MPENRMFNLYNPNNSTKLTKYFHCFVIQHKFCDWHKLNTILIQHINNFPLDLFCQRGIFTAFQMIFPFSLFLWAGSGKPCMTARSIYGTSRHLRQVNREEWFYLSDRTRLVGQIKLYFLAGGGRFHATGYVLFLLGISFFTDFSFEVFILIYLYFCLPPFSCLLVNYIRQSFSFWV